MAESLNFERQIIDHQKCYISGIYKIVPRNEIRFNGAVRFYAYYKPPKWANWGNRVNPAVECYETFDEAVEACRIHRG